jgi:hypothetical protein
MKLTLTSFLEGVSGMLAFQPAPLLRAEGAILLMAATTLYWREDGSWLLFALAFLAPDLSMVGYLGGPRVGATTYNAVHSTVLPVALAVVGIVTDGSLLTAIALIWLAHIGFDRMVGYGLKYADGFKSTHLARI